MNVRFLGSVFAAAALSAALFGCSGGGGAPGGSPSVSAPVTTPPLPLGQAGTDGRPGWSNSDPDKAVIAARSDPRPGSVTQSSNTERDSNTTVDRVRVDFREGTYTITNMRPGERAPEWEIGTANATALPNDIAADADTVGLVAPEDGGHRFVVAQTRSPTDGNTDWLTAGIWAFVPTDGSDSSYEFGAFADGGAPFRQGNLQALTGTASYGGRAFGVYYSISPDNDTSDAGPFGGTVELVASFGNTGVLGTIRGSVTAIVVEGGEEIRDAALMLRETPIGSENAGFFTGDTRMTLGGRTYEGRWGGQFFDNGAAGEAPGAVAGTFGAGIQQGNQAGALVGAFVAER